MSQDVFRWRLGLCALAALVAQGSVNAQSEAARASVEEFCWDKKLNKKC